jgi:hypothetical protein
LHKGHVRQRKRDFGLSRPFIQLDRRMQQVHDTPRCLSRKSDMNKIIANILLVTMIAGFAAACATTPPPEKAPIVRKG